MKTLIKRTVMALYCHGFLSEATVARTFARLALRSF